MLKMHVQLWRTIVQHLIFKKMKEKCLKNKIKVENYLKKRMFGNTVKQLGCMEYFEADWSEKRAGKLNSEPRFQRGHLCYSY